MITNIMNMNLLEKKVEEIIMNDILDPLDVAQ